MSSKVVDALASKYAELFKAKFDQLAIEGEWSKPWLAPSAFAQQNFRGNAYRGGNILPLSLEQTLKGYALPVWMTFFQAKDLGLTITRKGPASVACYDVTFRDSQTGRKLEITDDEYFALDAERRKTVDRRVFISYDNVFNIAQTDFSSRYPNIHADLLSRFGREAEHADCTLLEKVFSPGGWICPVREDPAALEPSYNLASNEIVMPPRASFPDSGSFYGTLLHEMAHSTGHPSCLGRETLVSASVSGYAAEELTAELSSAVLANMFGISPVMRPENERYLRDWYSMAGAEPKSLFDAVNLSARASSVVAERLGVERARGLDLLTVLKDVDEGESLQIRKAAELAAERREARRTQKRNRDARKGRGIKH